MNTTMMTFPTCTMPVYDLLCTALRAMNTEIKNQKSKSGAGLIVKGKSKSPKNRGKPKKGQSDNLDKGNNDKNETLTA